MALMDILAAAQGGQFFANAGRAAGLDAQAAERTLEKIGPAIATRLRKRAEDADAFDSLLDLFEDGDGDAFLDDASLIEDPEIIDDGNAILSDLYGSPADAASALVIRTNDAATLRLAAIGASAVLAALARSNAGARHLAGAQRATSDEGGGLMGTIISAVVKGAVQAAVRQLAPRRRRRRRYTSYFGTRRRRTTRRRRSRTPTLEQVFGEILGTSRR